MRILVTGGAGFIGSNFVKYILSKEEDFGIEEVVVLDKLTYAGNKINLLGEDIRFFKKINYNHLNIIEGDICDPAIVEIAMKNCDIVVNFAAETHVDRSIQDSSSFVKTDVLGTHVLLEQARKNGVELFLQFSTDEIYGDALHADGSKKDDPLMPKSPYAASKAGADRLVYSYGETYGLKNIITRACNVFGPFQYPEKLIPVTIKRLLEGQPVPVYGDGNNTREWIYVDNICLQVLNLIATHRDYASGIQHISSGNEMSVLQMVRKIADILKVEPLIKFVKDRPGHVKRHAINGPKIATTSDALANTVNWYKDNQQ